jgi:hypothetical protein
MLPAMPPRTSPPPDAGPANEGLRERKKRLMRQQLSDTATVLFLQRGFDAVRVAEVAEACGAIGMIRRFDAVVETTASVRAHQRDLTEQLVAVAAEVLAERAGVDPHDPRPRIVATALVGLLEIQSLALKRHLVPGRTLADVLEAVTADVRAAAGLVEGGMGAFPPA